MKSRRQPGERNSSAGLDALAKNVERLSLLLTRQREGIVSSYLADAGLREAYLRYFVPVNRIKVFTPLEELDAHPAGLLSRKGLNVLDVGSGPGTAFLGVMDFFSLRGPEGSGPKLDITAVDQVEENLREAERLFRQEQSRYLPGASLRTMQSGAERLGDRLSERFDMILLSNALNELFAGHGDRIGRRAEFLAKLLEKNLSGDGSCIIIEPALRETSRDLLMVKDRMLAIGLSAFSPCLSRGGCTALLHPRDWCHEDIPWDPPEIIRAIDERIGLRKDSLKFSYLVLRKDGLSLADIHGRDAFRVVSEPLISKGKVEFYLCGSGGRKLAVRLDKDKTEGNALFESLKRGMIVSFEGLVDEEKRWKVAKETKVVRSSEFVVWSGKKETSTA